MKFRDTFPDRFTNVGSAEQLMIGTAVGLSYEGFIPICYSITPFLLCRPFEFIRNYVDNEVTPVSCFGSGRDKDYDHDGFTHWANDAKKICSCFSNIKYYESDELTEALLEEVIYDDKPCFMSLKR